jgi:hypothetical protein
MVHTAPIETLGKCCLIWFLDCDKAAAIDGYGCGLENVSVHGTGCQGVDVRGGDTAALTPGGSFVRGSTVANASRWHRTYTPHVRIGGVGNVYSNNTLLNGPHSAMVGGCNDCVVDGNVFRRLRRVLRRTDMGPPGQRDLEQSLRGHPAQRPAARQRGRDGGRGVLR